jgi:hypothetical protein
MTVEQRPVPAWARRPEFRVGAVVAVALAIGFVVWLVAIRGGSSGSKGSTIGATAVSPDRLRALSVEVGHPIYWAGPATNTTYELTRTASGRIFVRYLPQGIPVGISNASFTIVGTYPVANAYKVLHQLAKKAGETSFSVRSGGFAVYAESSSTNIYLAYPNQSLQIEVYDPSPKRARSLITSGQVAPVP